MDLINILFEKALNNGDTTKEYVDEAIKALKGEVNADLDTLEELSKALGNDPNFFLTIKNEIDGFKTELVTNKDAATENTRFAIGVAEQNLEVPSMEEFNQLEDRKLDNTPDTWPVWTTEQQAQARENIAAAGVERVEAVKTALAGKLSEPADGLAVGKYFRVAAIDANGHAVLEAVDAKTVGVQDVQVAGASVVADGVANVPIATNSSAGVVQANAYDGWYMYGERLQSRTYDESAYKVANNTAVIGKGTLELNKYNLLKESMCDGVGAAWTADEQAAARKRMGIPGDYELIEEITLTEDVTIIVRQKEPDGTPYNFRNVIITAEISTCESKLAGQIDNNSYVLGSFTVESGKSGYFKFIGDVINTNSHIIDSQITTVGVTGSSSVTINTTPRVVESPRMFNYLRINANNSVIPSASVIKIYGVRA